MAEGLGCVSVAANQSRGNTMERITTSIDETLAREFDALIGKREQPLSEAVSLGDSLSPLAGRGLGKNDDR
jgi:hypothetical protein